MSGDVYDLDRFREMLSTVGHWVGTERVLLARLGDFLLRADLAFDPARFGATRLSARLDRVPELGTLERQEDGHLAFCFAADGAAGQGSRWAASADSQSDGPAEIETRLRGALFKAVTRFSPPASEGRFDLETLRPASTDPESAELIASQPERFLALPDAGEEFQRELALSFCADHLPEQLDALQHVLATDGWLHAARRIFEDGGVGERWTSSRQEAIVSLVLRWAKEHGIERRFVVAPQMARSGTRGPARFTAQRRVAATEASELRRVLHRLIDDLSDGELHHLPLPAWCLTRVRP